MGKKLKYQGGITKRICQRLADTHKKAFRGLVSKEGRFFNYADRTVNFEIISFSGASAFEDQLLSIYSFVHYGGVPIKWVIYSDGSYTQAHTDIFKKEFPFVTLAAWNTYDYHTNSDQLNEYSQICGLSKKINLIVGHPYQHQTIYVDSDIIFYKNFTHYINNPALQQQLWYVPDALGSLDRYFKIHQENLYALNSGLLILSKSFDTSDVFEYLKLSQGKYNYFSEQSSFEYAFKNQKAQILDPRQFIIDSADQFDFSIKYHPGDMAMRHYTSPVRHKIWQKGWKWHFEN